MGQRMRHQRLRDRARRRRLREERRRWLAEFLDAIHRMTRWTAEAIERHERAMLDLYNAKRRSA